MADLTDEKIDNICEGLTQNAAKVRFLRGMGLEVRRKPNGKPLVNSAHYDAVTGAKKDKFTGGPAANSSMAGPRWKVAA